MASDWAVKNGQLTTGSADGVPPPLKIKGDADWYEQKRGVDDDYIQPGNLLRLMTAEERGRLCKNIAGSLGKAPTEIQKKVLEHLRRTDKAYGDGVTKELGLL